MKMHKTQGKKTKEAKRLFAIRNSGYTEKCHWHNQLNCPCNRQLKIALKKIGIEI